jgi:hypothetical protein
VIVGYDAMRERHHVVYDDGEEQQLNLRKEQYRLTKR